MMTEQCETQTYHFEDDGSIPNSRWPLVIYRQCLQEDEEKTREVLEGNRWTNSWVDGIYDYHHYHSTAHEVLVILQGSATLQLGGPDGKILDVGMGDVLVIPAGVGHKCIEGSLALKVMGAYPEGQEWDTRKGEPGDRPEVLTNIANVPLPTTDPVQGVDGTLLRLWAE